MTWLTITWPLQVVLKLLLYASKTSSQRKPTEEEKRYVCFWDCRLKVLFGNEHLIKSFSVVWLCFSALFKMVEHQHHCGVPYTSFICQRTMPTKLLQLFIYRSRREICEKSWTSSLVPKQQFRLTLCHRLKARSYYRDILWFIYIYFKRLLKLKEQL